MANPILGGGGFHHVCLKTRDWDATLRFYQDTLGFTEKIAWRTAPQRAVMLDAGDGNYLEVFEDHAYEAAPQGVVYHFALRTTRLDEVAARVRAAGARITVEPRDVTIATVNGVGPVPVRIFFCEGPNGESIEFMQNSLT
ncbi:VOC family protein [Horticoccus luteus]|uniref:VOC family protein n=1 Tax=Horticoccus luteus TaxID=2862869 RepID=A0A8F9TVR6_9BACT|nr:VOC family protein [Horticoccus luteus]QYM78664.1 VOC family protein [Horticoccus luteus]